MFKQRKKQAKTSHSFYWEIETFSQKESIILKISSSKPYPLASGLLPKWDDRNLM